MPIATPETADPIWSRRAEASGASVRQIDEMLIRQYRPLVRKIASAVRHGRPKLRLDDLYCDGLKGLHEAIGRYSPAAGVKFESFAQHRIRGAMFDGIRDRDYASRQARHRGTAIKQVNRGFALAGIRDADDDQQSSRFSPRFTSRSEMERLEDIESFRELCRSLRRRERLILELRFCQDLNLVEIGQSIGLSESMVSVILTQCLRQLRAELGAEARDSKEIDR